MPSIPSSHLLSAWLQTEAIVSKSPSHSRFKHSRWMCSPPKPAATFHSQDSGQESNQYVKIKLLPGSPVVTLDKAPEPKLCSAHRGWAGTSKDADKLEKKNVGIPGKGRREGWAEETGVRPPCGSCSRGSPGHSLPCGAPCLPTLAHERKRR